MMILMRGVPGSGKSTAARILQKVMQTVGTRPCEIFSTDDYWYREQSGVYNWNPSKVGAAHSWNQARVKQAIADGKHVIVDNTNVSGYALMPYFDIALQNDLDVLIHMVDTPVETCIKRQNERPEDRRVPENVIRDMHDKLSRSMNITVESELEKAKLRSQIRSQLN